MDVVCVAIRGSEREGRREERNGSSVHVHTPAVDPLSLENAKWNL